MAPSGADSAAAQFMLDNNGMEGMMHMVRSTLDNDALEQATWALKILALDNEHAAGIIAAGTLVSLLRHSSTEVAMQVRSATLPPAAMQGKI